MQFLVMTLTQVWKKIVVLSVVAALSLIGLMTVAVQPSNAVPASMSDLSGNQGNETIEYPEPSYDELAAEAQDPQVAQKEYEKDVKIYRESGGEEGSLTESVKSTLEKITGQDE